MPADTLRLFVAIQPSEPARKALTLLQDGADRVDWTPASQLHLTLRFIGEVGGDAPRKVEEALARVRVRCFLLELAGTGGFPPRGHPAVLWAGVGKGHPLLHQLRQQVDDLLLRTNVPFELRAFVPHLTVGNSREATPVSVTHWLKRHRDFTGPTWPVNSFDLVASELGPSGASHTVVRTFPLL